MHASRGLAGRDFILLWPATLLMFAGMAPLSSVVPLWAAEGGAGTGGVGATTGVMMATTVLGQLGMGPLMRRFGALWTMAAGALLLGAPAALYVAGHGLAWVLAVSGVRGIGFGMVTVAGAVLVAALVDDSERGRAVGRYGVAVGLPNVLFLPLGVWAAQHVGFTPVFWASAVVGVLSVPLLLAISADGRSAGRRVERTPGAAEGSTVDRMRGFLGPWTQMLAMSCALGVALSFLPLAVAGAAPAALLAQSLGMIAGRWAAGVRGDRAGTGGLLVPAAIAGTLGMAGFALAAADVPGAAVVAVAAGAAYGLGFGALQTDVLVVMFRRAGPDGRGAASIAWNIAYDAGTGVGAMAIGLLSAGMGLPGSFAVVAVGIALIVPLSWATARGESRARAARTSSVA